MYLNKKNSFFLLLVTIVLSLLGISDVDFQESAQAADGEMLQFIVALQGGRGAPAVAAADRGAPGDDAADHTSHYLSGDFI